MAGPELLARSCDARVVMQARKNGRVRAAALYPSKFPFEISVWRTAYCDPDAKAREAKHGGIVLFEAMRVRNSVAGSRVCASKPPPPHAEIHLHTRATRFQRFASKADLKTHAKAWAEFTAAFDHLVEVAHGAREVAGHAKT